MCAARSGHRLLSNSTKPERACPTDKFPNRSHASRRSRPTTSNAPTGGNFATAAANGPWLTCCENAINCNLSS